MRGRPPNLLSFSPKYPLSSTDTGHLSDAVLSLMFCTLLLKDQSKSSGLPVDGLSDAWKLCLGFREPSFQPCVLAALAKNANPEHSWPKKFPFSRCIDINCY